jgi:hypothetical protein
MSITSSRPSNPFAADPSIRSSHPHLHNPNLVERAAWLPSRERRISLTSLVGRRLDEAEAALALAERQVAKKAMDRYANGKLSRLKSETKLLRRLKLLLSQDS